MRDTDPHLESALTTHPGSEIEHKVVLIQLKSYFPILGVCRKESTFHLIQDGTSQVDLTNNVSFVKPNPGIEGLEGV